MKFGRHRNLGRYCSLAASAKHSVGTLGVSGALV